MRTGELIASAAADRDPHRELAVEVVLARHRLVVTIRKSRFAWCFGMPQMPLPPFTEISVLTGRSQTYWPTPERSLQQGREEGRRRRAVVQAIATLNSTY